MQIQILKIPILLFSLRFSSHGSGSWKVNRQDSVQSWPGQPFESSATLASFEVVLNILANTMRTPELWTTVKERMTFLQVFVASDVFPSTIIQSQNSTNNRKLSKQFVAMTTGLNELFETASSKDRNCFCNDLKFYNSIM